MRSRGKVLVFGDDTRSFLAIVRSLGRKSVEVHVAPSDFGSPSLRSRFIARIHRLPPYLGDGGGWCRQVEELLRREAFDLVIPCDERTLLPLDRHRAALEGLSRLAIPDRAPLEVLFDKQKTRELAMSLGIPVAPGRIIRSEDNAATLVAEFGLPLVIKPCWSYRLESLYSRGRVEIFDREASLAQALVGLGNEPHLAESYRRGSGVGVSILASDGRVLQSFQHARVHERGGAGFYRVSVAPSPSLVASVTAIVTEMRFTGVAMFEFKVDHGSGSWILLEVNARPWGSMPLPLALGIDFPLRWYRLLVEGEETSAKTYKTGVYQRNLLQDARQTLALVKDMRGGPMSRLGYLLKTMGEFRRVIVGREHFDALVADDPAPGLCELHRGAVSAVVRMLREFPASRAARRLRDRSIVRRAMRMSRGRPAVVTMLCSGNVCRSPFAAELLRRAILDRSLGVRIVAAGILPRAGSCSPRTAIEVAWSHGVDLSKHRSTYLSERGATETTLAVVFDEHNRHYVQLRYPGLLQRTVMLGSFLGGGCESLEIDDPDGRGIATFERTYEAIATAIPGLAAAIVKSRGA